MSLSDFEQGAMNSLDRDSWNYFSYGAGRHQTLQDNERAFLRFIIHLQVKKLIILFNTTADVEYLSIKNCC